MNDTNRTLARNILNNISELVNRRDTWQDKRDAILAEADKTDTTELNEFLAWFEE